jgi:hypothetical protein
MERWQREVSASAARNLKDGGRSEPTVGQDSRTIRLHYQPMGVASAQSWARRSDRSPTEALRKEG